MKTGRETSTSFTDSKIQRVTKRTISDDIVQQLIGLIANGDLKPGSRLPPERELCQQFGAGRSSVREALRCLSIVGVINARAAEGTSVAPDGEKFLRTLMQWRLVTELHDIENLMMVRIALESVAVAQVASKGLASDLETLQGLLGRMEVAIADEDRFAKLDLEFHVTLAKASENTLLYDLVSMIRGQLMNTLSRVLPLPNAIPLSLEEHIRIVQAIKRRNSRASSAAMRLHLENALARYRAAVGVEQKDIDAKAKKKVPATRKRAKGR
jgi:GntR family transcriptional repressor for pyruvate dehydrogenase complex